MSTISCPRCQQDIKNAPTVEYLGLSISQVAGVIEWNGGDELTPLYNRRMQLLYQIMLGGSQGASVSSLIELVKGNGTAVGVHLSAIRHWLAENCLPLATKYHSQERRYSLVEVKAVKQDAFQPMQ